MEEKLDIIDRIFFTLEQIPVTSFADCERKLGITSGLRTLRKMIQQDAEKKIDKTVQEKTEEEVRKDG